jgi:beta-lactamase class A
MDVSGTVKLRIQEHHLFALASVAKIYILVAFLHEVAAENRDLTNEEHLLVEQMITESDNHAATDLWRRIGRYEGLSEYLEEVDLPPVERAYDDSWGSMRVTAANLAEVLAALYQRQLLPNRLTNIALEHLASVSDAQSWGLGTARDPNGLRVPAVYFKNGWYLEDEGWIANSVGIIADGAGTHVFVLLSDEHASLEDGQRFLGAATFILRIHVGSLPLNGSSFFSR